MSIVLLITACDEHQFTCTDGRCIPDSVTCNGVDDCGDNSDEEDPCGKQFCTHLNCKNQFCHLNRNANPLPDPIEDHFVNAVSLDI